VFGVNTAYAGTDGAMAGGTVGTTWQPASAVNPASVARLISASAE